MRVALVSPYSWTYPGGVTRHIDALGTQLELMGHEVSILAPVDPDDRRSRLLHRGARPQRRDPDRRVISLGRGVAFGFNGALSNVAITPYAVATLRAALRSGGFDVVHVHEPVVPMVSWDALCYRRPALVGTFHCYSTNPVSNHAGNVFGAARRMNHLHARIAVSEAAAWTARRFFGGRYHVIPNGVDIDSPSETAGQVPAGAPAAGGLAADAPPADPAPLRIAFVGQAVERKGLPVLLRAFEAVREHVPAELTGMGADRQEVAPLLLDEDGVRILGKVSDAEKRAQLRTADLLCAPSLGGESFGMVLTEAFAAGTGVVASDIPGYAGVVHHGDDGILLAPGDATALAEVLRGLALEPERCREMGRAAAISAQRYAWPRIAEDVLDVYEEARRVPEPTRALERAALLTGLRPADLRPRVRPRRLPRLERAPVSRRARGLAVVRRVALLAAAGLVAFLALLALQRIGLARIAGSLLASSPSLVVAGLALMCGAMVLRGFAWHSILSAALPRVRVRRSDALRGTFIGVLMSATLPARLGEPSRALMIARRVGRPRERLPVVLGTVISQAVLNIVALAGLGIAMFSSVNLFDGQHDALLLATVGPVAIALAVLLAPALLAHAPGARSSSAGVAPLVSRLRRALVRVREGLSVFRQPRRAAMATVCQLAAWGLQWLSCYVLLVAFGLQHRAGFAAAAAILFAVNVTAVLPATPSNLGVFQAACVAVLAGAYHVSSANALGYGIVLQAVEVATAVVMGMPALVNEGLSWRDVRLRAIHAAPVKLPALPKKRTPARDVSGRG